MVVAGGARIKRHQAPGVALFHTCGFLESALRYAIRQYLLIRRNTINFSIAGACAVTSSAGLFVCIF